MSELFQFQNEFIDFILLDKDPENLKKQIFPGGKTTSQQSLEVHKNGYVARLTEVLGDTFQAVWWMLGDTDFFAITEDYIKKNPSIFYDLNEYGRGFIDSLQNNTEFLFLADLAKFEWLFQEVFHLPPHKPIDKSELQKITEDQKIVFGDSVRLFNSDYNVYSIWKKRSDETNVLDVDEISKPNWLLLYKVNQNFLVYQLTKPQYFLMQNLMKLQTLSEAIEKTVNECELVEADVSELFRIIGSEGLVKHFSYGS